MIDLWYVEKWNITANNTLFKDEYLTDWGESVDQLYTHIS